MGRRKKNGGGSIIYLGLLLIIGAIGLISWYCYWLYKTTLMSLHFKTINAFSFIYFISYFYLWNVPRSSGISFFIDILLIVIFALIPQAAISITCIALTKILQSINVLKKTV